MENWRETCKYAYIYFLTPSDSLFTAIELQLRIKAACDERQSRTWLVLDAVHRWPSGGWLINDSHARIKMWLHYRGTWFSERAHKAPLEFSAIEQNLIAGNSITSTFRYSFRKLELTASEKVETVSISSLGPYNSDSMAFMASTADVVGKLDISLSTVAMGLSPSSSPFWFVAWNDLEKLKVQRIDRRHHLGDEISG